MDLKIARLRRVRGWTQSQLAQHSGTTQQQIARLEQGLVDPQLSTLQRVADALRVEVADLIFSRKEFEEVVNWVIASRSLDVKSLSLMQISAECFEVANLPAMHPFWEGARVEEGRIVFSPREVP